MTPSLTSTAKADRIFVFVVIATYAVSFIVVSLLVFIENDESQPLREIFQWGYLIPVAGYAIFSLWISFGLFLFLHKSLDKFSPEKRITRIIALPLSLIIGVPAGLILLDKNAQVAYRVSSVLLCPQFKRRLRYANAYGSP